jgi:hypothetical protein
LIAAPDPKDVEPYMGHFQPESFGFEGEDPQLQDLKGITKGQFKAE